VIFAPCPRTTTMKLRGFIFVTWIFACLVSVFAASFRFHGVLLSLGEPSGRGTVPEGTYTARLRLVCTAIDLDDQRELIPIVSERLTTRQWTSPMRAERLLERLVSNG
jgi:hypothetical protein